MDVQLMEDSNHFMCSLEDIKEEWLIKFPPRVIFHCARMAGSTPSKRKKAAVNGRKANERLISILEKLESPPTVIYCSGTLMYGEQTHAADENAALNPVGYAREYIEAERPWLDAQKNGLLDIRMARPAWIFGPASWFYYFFLKPAWTNGHVPFYGDGEQKMSLIALEDCASQLIHSYQFGERGLNYNLFGFEPISQKEFAKRVGEELNLTIQPIDRKTVENEYGTTVAEALCSNIPVSTVHDSWKEKYPSKYSDLSKLISTTLQRASALRSS